MARRDLSGRCRRPHPRRPAPGAIPRAWPSRCGMLQRVNTFRASDPPLKRLLLIEMLDLNRNRGKIEEVLGDRYEYVACISDFDYVYRRVDAM